VVRNRQRFTVAAEAAQVTSVSKAADTGKTYD
jgi:hypothetical protein